jgi:hypothetical protein
MNALRGRRGCAATGAAPWMARGLRRTLALVGLVWLWSCAALEPQRPPPPANAVPALDGAIAAGDDAERLHLWREDIDAYESLLRTRHAGLFAVLPREQFDAEFAALRRDLPSLRDDQIVVRLQQIAASIGSGHTTVQAERGRLVPQSLPISCVWLADGVMIAAADDDHAQLRGAQLLGVGACTLAEVLDKLATVTPHENDAYLKHGAMRRLTEVQTLRGLGVIEAADAVPLRVRCRDGREEVVVLHPIAAGAKAFISSGMDPERISWTRLARPENSVYGARFDAEQRALFVWYDACRDTPDRSVSQFCEETLAQIDALHPRAVIVDLRRNGGGNSALLHPFIRGVRDRSWLNDPRRLFVLIGRMTFSSAGLNTEEFRTWTRATLVGEPTGHRPDSWMESRWDWLPNSLLFASYMLYEPEFAPNKPDACVPDVVAAPTREEWLSGRDVAYERALELAAPAEVALNP